MKKTKLTPKRILLEFPTRKELTLHLWRISECFEGEPGIRGVHFSFDEFVDKYSDKKGNLDYFSFWDGYNIPMDQFKKFLDLFGNELSKREQEVKKAVHKLPNDGYFIACVEGDKVTLKHENAHGRFFDDKEYQEKATAIIESIQPKLKRTLIAGLKKNHYQEDTFTDELHAYILAWNKDDQEDIFGNKATLKDILKYKKQLEDL